MSEIKYKAIPVKISVCLEEDNPIFGESKIDVSVEDEAAGFFIKLEDYEGNKISMDFEQLEAVFMAAKNLMLHEDKENEYDAARNK